MRKQKNGIENEISSYKQALALEKFLVPSHWDSGSFILHFSNVEVTLN